MSGFCDSLELAIELPVPIVCLSRSIVISGEPAPNGFSEVAEIRKFLNGCDLWPPCFRGLTK